VNVGTGVFVLQNESTLVAMQAASFASEDDFQRLLAAFPELLAGDQIDAEVPRLQRDNQGEKPYCLIRECSRRLIVVAMRNHSHLGL